MTEEPEIVDADDSNCAVCGVAVYNRDASFFLEVFEPGVRTASLEVGFCSWEHVAEWSAHGPPEFPEYSDEPWVPSLRDRIADGFTFASISVWWVLGAFGAYTAVMRLT